MRPFRCRAGGLFLFVVLCTLVTSQRVWAQAGTATVYGDVKDPQGAALPGAAVTLTSVDTGAVRTAVSNETGGYRFVALTPGMYTLKVEMQSFRTGIRDKLQLPVDTATKLDVSLELGSLAESVEVAASSPILNTTDASLGNVITGIQIQQLPLEARNPVGLLSLQAGAVYVPSGDQRSGSVSGARSDQSNVTLDGVDVNDPQWGYAYNSVLRVTLESLQEFRVSTSNYSADMGRSSAAQVSLVTKSGTNQYRGAGYFSQRDTRWSSNEYFLKLTQLQSGLPSTPPKLDKMNFGGALGGPVKRDRLFFFGNYERLAESSEDPVLRNVPSSTLRDGVLVYVCGVASACPGGTVNGFTSSHSIPAGRYGLSPAEIAALDPLGIGPSRAASDLFRKYPLPNDPGRDGINYMGYRFSAPIENEFNTFITRLDYLIDRGGNHKLFFRGGKQDDTVNSAPQFEGQAPNTQRVGKNFGYAVGYDAVLSSNLVNTFRYGLSKIDDATVGLRQANAVTFRFITDFNALTSTNGREVPTHNIVNDMSWLKGNHNVKFGTNIRFTRAPKYSNANSFHTGNNNPSWVAGTGRNYMPGSTGCGNPLCGQLPAVASSFSSGYGDPWLTLLGVISQPTASYNYDKTGTALPSGAPVVRKYATDEYEFYVQDSWRVRPNLTVTGGVRYNLYSPPWEVNGLQLAPSVPLGDWFEQRRANMLKGVGDNALPPVTLDLAGPANGKKGFYDWDYNNFGPRIAAAWTPHANGGFLGWLTGGDKMVVRGGYSLLYDRVGFALATIFDEGGSFGMSTSISSTFGTSDETVPAARFRDLATLPPTLPAPPPGGFPSTPPIGNVAIYQSIDNGITTPYHHVFNAVVGRELSRQFAIEAAYVGRRGRDLLIRRDLAMPMDIVDPRSGVNYFTAARQLITAYRQAGVTSATPQNFLGHRPDRLLGEHVPRRRRGGVWRGYDRHAADGAPVLPERSRLDDGAVLRRHRVQPGVQRARAVCLLEQPVLAAARPELDGDRRLQLDAGDAAQALERWLSVRRQLHAEQVHRPRLGGRTRHPGPRRLLRLPAEFMGARPAVLLLGLRRPSSDESQLGGGSALRAWPRHRRQRARLAESGHQQLAVLGRVPLDQRVPLQRHQLPLLLADQLELSGQRGARGAGAVSGHGQPGRAQRRRPGRQRRLRPSEPVRGSGGGSQVDPIRAARRGGIPEPAARRRLHRRRHRCRQGLRAALQPPPALPLGDLQRDEHPAVQYGGRVDDARHDQHVRPLQQRARHL